MLRDLYIIQEYRTGNFKIGISENPYHRLDELQTGNPNRLRLLLILPGRADLERPLHRRLSRYRLAGEWFQETAITELPDWIYEQIDLEDYDWFCRDAPEVASGVI